MPLVKSIQEVSRHRNGVGGAPFYAVRFTSDEVQGHPDANFLATVFDDSGVCAVICLDLIPTVGVKFAHGNSWRGDRFEGELRQAIREIYGDDDGGEKDEDEDE